MEPQPTIWKFGGASLATAAGIRNVGQIVARHRNGPLVLVVSAMGKTTNALEELAHRAARGDEPAAWEQFAFVRQFHQQAAEAVLDAPVMQALETEWAPLWTELERTVRGILLLRDFPPRFYDYIMAFGELFSSQIVCRYLGTVGVPAVWADARKLIITDANYQNANVLAGPTAESIQHNLRPELAAGRIPVVQGFIGANAEGYTTTLGREGSDYTAALLGSCLNASQVAIWKDVPGVMSADPKRDPAAVFLPSLTYTQAVEMTFYGATVIHPKTIRPLRTASIPLWVKSYEDPAAPGTAVAEDQPPATVTIRVWRPRQALLTLSPRDFSFMDEAQLREASHRAWAAGLQLRLVQQTAISLLLCVQDDEAALAQFAARVADIFTLETQRNLELVTILNPAPTETPPANAVLVQQTPGRVQWLLGARG